jgi:hypothetical protein
MSEELRSMRRSAAFCRARLLNPVRVRSVISSEKAATNPNDPRTDHTCRNQGFNSGPQTAARRQTLSQPIRLGKEPRPDATLFSENETDMAIHSPNTDGTDFMQLTRSIDQMPTFEWPDNPYPAVAAVDGRINRDQRLCQP